LIVIEPLNIVIEELSKLPGIGKKTAQRLALHILNSKMSDVESLSSSIHNLKTKIKICNICNNISIEDICQICNNTKRDHASICVVENVNDLFAIEKSNEFNGVYHVLGGVLSPLSGIGPDNLKIKELTKRITDNDVKEIILALNPDTEGETTTLYLANMLKRLNLKISRIARGLPVGSDIEFIDDATISSAFKARTII